jgi:hypothetical protein
VSSVFLPSQPYPPETQNQGFSAKALQSPSFFTRPPKSTVGQQCNLTEIDFFSPNSTLENLDQEDPLADEQSKMKIFALTFSSVISLLGFCLIGRFPRLSFQILSFDQEIVILPC